MSNFQSRRLNINSFQRLSAFIFVLAALTMSIPGFCGPIHDAARAGDLDKVKALIKENPALVASKDEKFGQTALHIAAFNDRKEVVEFLLANKADVNAKSKNGSTPLHLAAGKGNKDIVELLLANGAQIDALDNEGWSPARSAIVFNQKAIEELLLAKGGKEIPASPAKPAPPAPAPPKTPAEKAPPIKVGEDGPFNLFDDGTVVDTRTKLMWMGRDNGSGLSWPNVKKYVADYRGAGYSDWRLPTLAEVSGLYDKINSHRAICPAAVDDMGATADQVHLTKLIRLTCTRVWTSDESSGKPGMATVFDFHAGKDAARPETPDFIDTASRVLVVRKMK